MQYGAKMIQWAPFAATDPETASAPPKLGTPANLGALNKVTETINFNRVSAYGDNVKKVEIVEFKDGSLAVETLYLSNANAAAVTGAELGTTDGDKDLKFSSNDTAPYGSLAFYTNHMRDDGTKYYQGIFYPKVKANMEGESYETKGDSIVLSNAKLTFTVFEPLYGKYKHKSEEFDTEAKAAAWVNEKIKAAAGG